jgi:branched-subunit amino acid transport protein
MSDFLATVAVGLGTYASRALFIVALANRTIPARVLQALQYVGPAVLASLIVAFLIDSEGGLVLEYQSWRLSRSVGVSRTGPGATSSP